MSKRVRKRYLALKVVSEQLANEKDVINAVWNALLKLFGEYGASQANLRLIEADPRRDFVIIRCSHTATERIRASIASITEINGKPAALHVMGVSGTLRALRRKALT